MTPGFVGEDFKMSIPRTSPTRWNEITAVFGGRFDPPHVGHREAVKGLFRSPGVKEVIILPSGNSPHKPSIGTISQRAEMAKLAFSSLTGDLIPSGIWQDPIELNRAKINPNLPTYSFDTLNE